LICCHRSQARNPHSEKARKELTTIAAVTPSDRGLSFDESLTAILGFMSLVDDVEARDELLDSAEDMTWVLLIDEMELLGSTVSDLPTSADASASWVDLVERSLLDEGHIVSNEIDDGVDEVWMREGS
jgi:hypothetical protein